MSKRPKILKGITTKVLTGCGKLFVTLNVDEAGVPTEILCRIGKAGGCEGAQNEALGRLTSLVLRLGGSLQTIIKQLKELKCNKPLVNGGETVLSCADGLCTVLEAFVEINKGVEK